MSEHLCVLCPVYRPDADARNAETVCRSDRFRLARDVLAVATLYRRLLDGDEPVVDNRRYEVRDEHGRSTGAYRAADPLAVFDGAGAISARSSKPPVSGSRSAPIPINVDAVDLTGAARNAPATGSPGDQVGFLPVATVLDGWVRYTRAVLHPDFSLPSNDVDSLVQVLHRDIDDMCDRMPADVVQLATDLKALIAAMRMILRESEPVPQPLLGVRCEHCQKMSTLVPWLTGEYTECAACGQLYTPQDRAELGRRQLAAVRRPRSVRLSGALPGMA